METDQSLEIIATHLDHDASAKNVYGEPIITQGKTILPVAKVSLGMGSGFGKKQAGSERENKLFSGKTAHMQDGGGSGGRLVAQPTGVFEITGKGTRYIPADTTRYIVLGGIVGLLIGRWLAYRKYRKDRI